MKRGAILMTSAVLTLATVGVTEGPTAQAGTSNAGAKATNEVKIIDQAARQGGAPGISYVSGKTNIGVIRKAWGKPDNESFAGAGMYDTYSRHHAAFGVNKGEQLFDVRSYAENLHAITEKDVEKVLGTPGAIHHYAGEQIWLYPAGSDYQLLWAFTAPTKKHPMPHVDHISVFNPQASVNSMAATGPAPTPTIVTTPGADGHLFTFSIPKLESGYQVSEFEWISRNGRNVINTLDGAIRNGATGKVPGFEVSGDGQTLSFDYPSSMAGHSGYVRIIAQNSSGRAMIGQSGSIRLK